MAMSAASSFFRLCRQRQLQSSLAPSARQAARKLIIDQRRIFASLRPLYVQPIDVAAPPEQVVSSTIIANASCESPTIPIVENSLVCGNLAPGIEEHIIIEVFSKYGTVTSTRLPTIRNKTSSWAGSNGGFCFVAFASAQEASDAQKAVNGTEIAGRIVHVQHETKGSPRMNKPLSNLLKIPLSARDQEYISTQPLSTGTVVRSGTMLKTVAVTNNRRYIDDYTKTHHVKGETVLVHDPEGILAEGDVVKYQHFPPDLYDERAARGKKNVRFILKEVVTPFGIPVAERTSTLSTKTNPDKVGGKTRKRKESVPVAGSDSLRHINV